MFFIITFCQLNGNEVITKLSTIVLDISFTVERTPCVTNCLDKTENWTRSIRFYYCILGHSHMAQLRSGCTDLASFLLQFNSIRGLCPPHIPLSRLSALQPHLHHLPFRKKMSRVRSAFLPSAPLPTTPIHNPFSINLSPFSSPTHHHRPPLPVLRPPSTPLSQFFPPNFPTSPPKNATPTTILDSKILVPSSLPRDNFNPVQVSLYVESLGGRIRRVRGSIPIPTSLPRVWRVLTTYSKIALYMPNILSSTVQKVNGILYLEQVGLLSKTLGLRSRMVVSVHENESCYRIRFHRVEGRDFVQFDAVWWLEQADHGVNLRYELIAKPFALFPMALVERKMYKEMPIMLAAVREEALVGRYIPIEDERVTTI